MKNEQIYVCLMLKIDGESLGNTALELHFCIILTVRHLV